MARVNLALLVLLLLSAALYLSANFFFRINDGIIEETDLDYIATHCTGVPNISGIEIADNLIADRDFDGTVYIYDGNPVFDDVPAFEIAWRGTLSELLCAPIFGCLLAPRLSDKCLSGAE
jgi:hypothetical protein